MAQIFAGLFTEGTTDVRFLEAVVAKTIERVAFNCTSEFDIELFPIQIEKTGLDYISQVLAASKKGIDEFGMIMLCVQADADSETLEDTYQNKVIPALKKLEEQDETVYCKTMVAIVPIQETESWMLADKELLKKMIGTNKTDAELGINRQPESIANPKELIEFVIRTARQEITKRRRRDLTISELYFPMGQAIELDKLDSLPSYQDFMKNVKEAFRKLNYFHD